MSDGHNLSKLIEKLVKETIYHPGDDGSGKGSKWEQEFETRGQLLADKILNLILQEHAWREDAHRLDMQIYRQHALLLVERFDSLNEAFRLFAKAFQDKSEAKEAKEQ